MRRALERFYDVALVPLTPVLLAGSLICLVLGYLALLGCLPPRP